MTQYSRVRKYSQDLKNEIKRRKREKLQQKSAPQHRADVFLYLIFFFIFAYEIYFFFFSSRNIFSYMEKERYKEQLIEEGKQLDAQIRELEREKFYLENDRFYIEKEARERLGYMKRDEEVYIIPEKKDLDGN